LDSLESSFDVEFEASFKTSENQEVYIECLILANLTDINACDKVLTSYIYVRMYLYMYVCHVFHIFYVQYKFQFEIFVHHYCKQNFNVAYLFVLIYFFCCLKWHMLFDFSKSQYQQLNIMKSVKRVTKKNFTKTKNFKKERQVYNMTTRK
jgi:hypothetical protein